jgi:hypothetical protein
MFHFLNLVRLLAAAVLFHSPSGHAFVPSETVGRPSSLQKRSIELPPLLSSSRPPPEEPPLQDYNNEIPEAADFRQFLNQCAIQSFLFLLTQTRDPHTIKWLDSFTRPTMGPYGSNEIESPLQQQGFVETDKRLNSRLLQYHGLSAMNTTIFKTWDSYFKLLLQEPPTQIHVTSNNPLVREFVIDISPPSLCSRILSVRSQISNEWVRDLQVIAQMGSQIFYSYWDNLEQERNEKKGANEMITESDTAPTSGWIPVPPLSSQERSAGFERISLLFLEWDPNEDSEYAPSPLRKGNFDLLLLLTTQEAIRRILLQQKDLAGIQYLKSFYNDRKEQYFSRGSGRYGRADDFLEQLMLSPPSIVLEKYSEETVLIDPLRLAEVIVLERQLVCNEWAKIAKQSPEEHMEIQKLQLDRMMNM